MAALASWFNGGQLTNLEYLLEGSGAGARLLDSHGSSDLASEASDRALKGAAGRNNDHDQ
jgi:hypothetical protein